MRGRTSEAEAIMERIPQAPARLNCWYFIFIFKCQSFHLTFFSMLIMLKESVCVFSLSTKRFFF